MSRSVPSPTAPRNRLRAWCFLLLTLALLPSLPAAEPAPKRLPLPGIENAYQVTDRILSGGQPEGDDAFAALRRQGVQVLVSVDGTRPDVERAARFGLRYIHLPHGYDGIPTNTALQLIRAAQVTDGPVFIHCHHGKHRSPAAASLVAQAIAGWTTNQAVRWMQEAGTAPEYAGLYRANLQFHAPSPEMLARVPTHFSSVTRVSGLVETMVGIDQRWDRLKAVEKAGWRVPAGHPDLVPAAEALLLQEAYKELGRDAELRARGADWARSLQQAADTAGRLQALLRRNSLPLSGAAATEASDLLQAMGRQCAACHRAHRN